MLLIHFIKTWKLVITISNRFRWVVKRVSTVPFVQSFVRHTWTLHMWNECRKQTIFFIGNPFIALALNNDMVWQVIYDKANADLVKIVPGVLRKAFSSPNEDQCEVFFVTPLCSKSRNVRKYLKWYKTLWLQYYV
jgi:hypothetical protein